MKKILASLIITIVMATFAAADPHFEVASITPCKPGTPENPLLHMGAMQFVSPGGRFTASSTSLKYLIEWAYGIQSNQLTGGPSWLDTEMYDIAAKAEGNPSTADMKLMLQKLLNERFKLKLHQEQKRMTAYVISTARNSAKLTPVKEGETHAMRFAPINGPDQKQAGYHITGTRYTVADVAALFSRQIGRVIVDQTGLDGEFDFTVDLMPDDSRTSPVEETLLLTALREQLGFTVKAQTLPVNVFVIDSAEKVAAGN